MAETGIAKVRRVFGGRMLDAEQLDGVAGGSAAEMADDSRFLNVLLQGRPGCPARYGESPSDNIRGELATAWATVGIDFTGVDGNPGHLNSYSDKETGRSLTQGQAMDLAMQRVGRQLKKRDWKW